ncbi:MAG TPA: 4Fe-4S dicluster domain-containing protein [Armatimonadetes bacterium]|nr:4Fe-4S dicluster domain-containing protein [Armatimonadota bacterium]
MTARVDAEQCNGCAMCVDVCPQGAITMNAVAHVDETRCIGCGICARVCPTNAIQMVQHAGMPTWVSSSLHGSTPPRQVATAPMPGQGLRLPGMLPANVAHAVLATMFPWAPAGQTFVFPERAIGYGNWGIRYRWWRGGRCRWRRCRRRW